MNGPRRRAMGLPHWHHASRAERGLLVVLMVVRPVLYAAFAALGLMLNLWDRFRRG